MSAQSCRTGAPKKDKDFCPLSFEDSTETEVLQRFTPKKKQSEQLRDVYLNLGLSQRAIRVDSCGSFLEWHVQDAVQKLAHANFCKDRLCPMCSWRRSLKIFGQVSQVMAVLQGQGFEFLFLTLTVKNCAGADLGSTLAAMQKSWERMLHRSRVQNVVAGTFRAVEVTRNFNTGLYHPHYHLILAVRSDYFHRSYIKQSEWGEIWRSCCSLDYNPIIDIRNIKSSSKGLSGAVAEVAKYAVKGSDYLSGSWSERSAAVHDLLVGLTQRKLVSWTGCFLDAVKSLHLDDIETGDLVNVDATELRPDVAYMIVRWHWAAGCYQRSETELVSAAR